MAHASQLQTLSWQRCFVLNAAAGTYNHVHASQFQKLKQLMMRITFSSTLAETMLMLRRGRRLLLSLVDLSGQQVIASAGVTWLHTAPAEEELLPLREKTRRCSCKATDIISMMLSSGR